MTIFRSTIFLTLIIGWFTFSGNKLTSTSSSIKEENMTLIRGPYLQVGSPTGMTIRWRTMVNERSRVKYGLTPDNLNMSVDDSTLTFEHIIRVEGLKPSTKYYYSIGTFNDVLQGDSTNYFHTLPEIGKEGKYRIAALGDCGMNNLNQRQVRDELLKYIGKDDLTAWILLGDNAYQWGTDAQYQSKFFNIYKDRLLKNYPLFPSPGNHDYRDMPNASAEDLNKVAYFQNFSMPTKGESGGEPSLNQGYYSFDVGNVHFLSLDSYGKDKNNKRFYSSGQPEQVEWVKRDLKANKNKKWIVAYWHHPPYTMGSHDSDSEGDLVKIRENFINILEDNGVDLIICGHSHVYERSKLMYGHYGMEADFDERIHNVSHSTALYDGSKNSAPYMKTTENKKGTVYIVSGSAGALGGQKEKYPHNAMYYSNNEVGGSLMLEVEGDQLDVKWICSDGQIRDKFTMLKNVSKKDEKILLKDIVIKK